MGDIKSNVEKAKEHTDSLSKFKDTHINNLEFDSSVSLYSWGRMQTAFGQTLKVKNNSDDNVETETKSIMNIAEKLDEKDRELANKSNTSPSKNPPATNANNAGKESKSDNKGNTNSPKSSSEADAKSAGKEAKSDNKGSTNSPKNSSAADTNSTGKESKSDKKSNTVFSNNSSALDIDDAKQEQLDARRKSEKKPPQK